MTKISIVTAVLNRAYCIEQALVSLRDQTYKNFEHLIIDGASTDGTLSIINKFIDERSKLISEPDEGIYDALNKGIHLATGDVVGFLHADDFYASQDVLEKIAKIFDDPSVSAVYGDLIYVSQANSSKIIRRWKSNSFKENILGSGWMPPHPTLYVRREWYSNLGCFDVNYSISADYLSILKFFSHPNFKSVYLPEILVIMRIGGASNQSIKAIIRKLIEDWKVLRFCKFSLFSTMRAIIGKNFLKIPQFFNFRKSHF